MVVVVVLDVLDVLDVDEVELVDEDVAGGRVVWVSAPLHAEAATVTSTATTPTRATGFPRRTEAVR